MTEPQTVITGTLRYAHSRHVLVFSMHMMHSGTYCDNKTRLTHITHKLLWL